MVTTAQFRKKLAKREEPFLLISIGTIIIVHSKERFKQILLIILVAYQQKTASSIRPIAGLQTPIATVPI